ncbi:DUF2637 domain-containing protein [Nocardia sp. NPDC005366]|uniref:DUF2637 domain-containing protein n=1 Tax=Nocardia sp. NPDC005366 TaxID=3156878 RepID=UPI0033B6198D
MSAADQHKSAAMKWARWSAAVIILAVGAAAFRLSFTTLQDLAVLARVPKSDAWLFPLIVDGTILLATFGVLVSPSKSSEQRFFLAVLGIGAAVSVAGNSIHAMASGHPLPGWAAAIVAAVAPISLLADTHGLALLFRAVHRGPEVVSESAPVAVPAAGEVAVDPVSADSDAVASTAPARVTAPVKPVAKKPARTDPKAVARAVELHGQGMKYADIARELGVSARTAAKYAKSATASETVDYETIPAQLLDSPTPAPEPEHAPVRVASPVPVRVAPVRPVRPVQTMLPVAAIPAGSF